MRPVRLDDADQLCQAYLRGREHLRPWEPRRSEDFFTPEGQLSSLREQLDQRDAGRSARWVLVEEDTIIGSIALSNIVLGVFRSGNLGYWVDARRVGRGLATAAVRLACQTAGEQLGLHRVEAGTVISNKPSQRVLAKCGFALIGTAPNYLHIDGTWRDHLLFQKILNDRPPA